jgi:uncharacterized protein YggL (DUF469 family)
VKKRLRKKLRLGEFREVCFEVTFEFDATLDSSAMDRVMDEFIEMIEANQLQFGGGGSYRSRIWEGVVGGPSRGSVTAEQRASALAWLKAHPGIAGADAGPLRDAWHGWS